MIYEQYFHFFFLFKDIVHMVVHSVGGILPLFSNLDPPWDLNFRSSASRPNPFSITGLKPNQGLFVYLVYAYRLYGPITFIYASVLDPKSLPEPVNLMLKALSMAEEAKFSVQTCFEPGLARPMDIPLIYYKLPFAIRATWLDPQPHGCNNRHNQHFLLQ